MTTCAVILCVVAVLIGLILLNRSYNKHLAAMSEQERKAHEEETAKSDSIR